MEKYKIDHEFRALKHFKLDISTPSHIVTVRQGEGLLKHLARKKKHGVSIDCITVPGHQGDMIEIYAYNPKQRRANAPFVLHFHGGAFAMGNALNNTLLYRYAHLLGCPVFSVEYRLAPEYPFPYGVNDCFAALEYLTQHAKTMGLNASRVVVTGDSAGGGLAASVCQMARDKGIKVSLQLLIYPVLSNACDTPSMKAFTDTPVWDYSNSIHMWQYYLPLKAGEKPPKYAVPALGKLKGLAPCYIETAEFDPLRDEGIAYAKALEKAGVPVHLEATKGTVHGYDQLPRKGPIAKRQISLRIAAMARALDRSIEEASEED